MRRVENLLAIGCVSAALLCVSARLAHADVILDFNDIPPGTLVVFNPYVSQEFSLSSSAGGFVFNSPGTGGGSPQTPGNNPFYAGANGLASFSPATIDLRRTDGEAFSLLSIDLARNFVFDPAPTVTFTGMIAGGGSVTETFTVTTPSGPPHVFQSFAFSGFTHVSSVTWLQPPLTEGLHQFSDIHLTPPGQAVPEPSGMALLALGLAWIAARRRLGGYV